MTSNNHCSSPESSPENWFYSPESTTWIEEEHPLHDRVIQFTALQELGYPVELQPIDARELPDNYSGTDEYGIKRLEWLREHRPVFLRPVVLLQEFDKFVQATEAPGDCPALDDETIEQIEIHNHPMRLAFDINSEPVSMNAYRLREWRDKGKNSSLSAPLNPELITADLLEKCFMASFELFLEKLTTGHPLYDVDLPRPDDIRLYSELAQKGQKSITAEELRAIMLDYYRTIENLSPEFKLFKNDSL